VAEEKRNWGKAHFMRLKKGPGLSRRGWEENRSNKGGEKEERKLQYQETNWAIIGRGRQ